MCVETLLAREPGVTHEQVAGLELADGSTGSVASGDPLRRMDLQHSGDARRFKALAVEETEPTEKQLSDFDAWSQPLLRGVPSKKSELNWTLCIQYSVSLTRSHMERSVGRAA